MYLKCASMSVPVPDIAFTLHCAGMVVVLLAGGDKSTQQTDIKRAVDLSKEI